MADVFVLPSRAVALPQRATRTLLVDVLTLAAPERDESATGIAALFEPICVDQACSAILWIGANRAKQLDVARVSHRWEISRPGFYGCKRAF